MTKFFANAAIAAIAAVTLQAAPAEARRSNDGFDRRVVIVNESSRTISEVRGTPTTWDGYGRDLIPNFVIESGEQARVNFDVGTGQCLYDLQVKMRNGQTVEKRNVDVCRVTSWTIED